MKLNGVTKKFYGYLNLESTKTVVFAVNFKNTFYGYLNLESTKTVWGGKVDGHTFYGYLNLESTKTLQIAPDFFRGFTVT